MQKPLKRNNYTKTTQSGKCRDEITLGETQKVEQ